MINIKKCFDKYKTLREAPDALMAEKNSSVSFSLYRRDKKDTPIWASNHEGNGIAIALIDAAVIAGTVAAAVCVSSALLCLYRRARYAKRW